MMRRPGPRVFLAAFLGLAPLPALAQPAAPMPPLPVPPATPPPAVAPAPAPAAPAAPAAAAAPSLDDFGGSAVVHAEPIDGGSPLAYACAQARVWLESRDDVRACYPDAAATALAALDTESKRLVDQACSAVPLDAPGAEALRTGAFAAYEKVVFASKSPAGFEKYLESPAQQAACKRLLVASLVAGTDTEVVPDRNAEIEQSRRKAHATDLLRKASTTLTGMITGNGQAESPGSPDALAVALMTALGADRETSGSHVVMTLNLAALAAPKTEQRLKLAAPLRNLFLRLSAPLESTEAALADADPDAVSSVRRISAVLGTSLLDSTDPRLAENQPCYEQVLDYLPPATTLKGEESRRRDRETYFDICHRRAAWKQRVAIRGGVSVFTSDDARSPETRAELLAGALVYAPVPWLYTNLIYQRVLEPGEAHVMGGGFSLAGNVGGPDSGVAAWGRFGIDTLFLMAKADQASDWDWEWRIVPTIRAKLGDNVTQLGIGPRIVESGDTGLFATLALTYDADNLIDPLVSSHP
jgi:hypothetical protein